MTRTYAAIKLLEHGPLSRKEFIEITGWSLGSCNDLLKKLVVRGKIKQPKYGMYAL